MFWIFGIGGPGVCSSVFPRGKGIRGVGLPPGVNKGVFFLDLGEFVGGGNFRVLKEKILGGRKKPQEAIAIRHPETNELLTNRKEIMETTLKYCKELLAKKGPSNSMSRTSVVNERYTIKGWMRKRMKDMKEAYIQNVPESSKRTVKEKKRKI